MNLFIGATLAYFCLGTVISYLLRGDPYFVAGKVLGATPETAVILTYTGSLVIVLLLASYRTSQDMRAFAKRIALSLVALVVASIFLAVFSSIKTALPYIADAFGLPHFFADPTFAWLDRALHFGTDPWVFTHQAVAALGGAFFVDVAAIVYAVIWSLPAYYLPSILFLMGEDRATVRHFISLYLFAWVVLGNVVALAALSGGPIYYDIIHGTQHYAAMFASFAENGWNETMFARQQGMLWEAYTTEDQAIGSGISAFPSLHVAMATVTALYMSEKHAVLGAVGWITTLFILFASVWNGYHYAIDGYVSLLAVIGLHYWLRKRRGARQTATQAL